MFNPIQPPAPQAMQRRLWFDLELRYWLYLAGAVLLCALVLLLGPGAWWQKLLLCGVLLSLSTLPAARWGGVHLDSHLWWEGRHALQLVTLGGLYLFRVGSRRWWEPLHALRLLRAGRRPPPAAHPASLRHRQGSRGTRAEALVAAPVLASNDAAPGNDTPRWWQETDWDAAEEDAPAPLEEAADLPWDAPEEEWPAVDEEAEERWTDEIEHAPETALAGEAGEAEGGGDDWAEGWVDAWAEGWMDAHAPLEGWQRTHLLGYASPALWRTPAAARAAGLAWDTGAGAYDPPALFLLDQTPRFPAPAAEAFGQILAWPTATSKGA